LWSGGPLALQRGGSPLLGAGMPIPFPCGRPGESYAGRHGAGVPARGPTYVPQSLPKPAYMFLEKCTQATLALALLRTCN
jgi:hypothetical protein